jgi:hypothetical protein
VAEEGGPVELDFRNGEEEKLAVRVVVVKRVLWEAPDVDVSGRIDGRRLYESHKSSGGLQRRTL